MAKTCWARCLGDCEGGISGEHLFSEALFATKMVNVVGQRFRAAKPKLIAVEGLKSGILCARHNSALSLVDTEGGMAFDVFRQARQLSQVRRGLPGKNWSMTYYHINGPLLERWFLKTLLNVCYGGPKRIGKGTHPDGEPSEYLVKAAFGQEAFQHRAGLYLVARAGEEIDESVDDHVMTDPVLMNDEAVVGCFFMFFSFRFFLCLEDLGPPPTDRMVDLDPTWEGQLIFHPRAIDMRDNGKRSQVIRFDW